MNIVSWNLFFSVWACLITIYNPKYAFVGISLDTLGSVNYDINARQKRRYVWKDDEYKGDGLALRNSWKTSLCPDKGQKDPLYQDHGEVDLSQGINRWMGWIPCQGRTWKGEWEEQPVQYPVYADLFAWCKGCGCKPIPQGTRLPRGPQKPFLN